MKDENHKIEKIDSRLRELEILTAGTFASHERSIERAERGIIRAEKTRIKHTEALMELRPILDKVNENQYLLTKIENKINEMEKENKKTQKETEGKLVRIREKMGSFGKINVVQILIVAVSTYLGTVFGKRLLK